MTLPLLFVSSCALLSIAICSTSSPFMSLIYAVMLFINGSFVLFMLGYEFLALVNMLVYVGALAVLFLFLIMLLEVPTTELRSYQRGWSTLCIVAVLAWRLPCLLLAPRSAINPPMVFIPNIESISSLGQALFLRYADLLILNSLILTVALIGALVLAHVRPV
jgi:NADH:ubiquinone oxidoreductase subunit 6 (subunit J)